MDNSIALDLFQTAALSVVSLYIGVKLKHKCLFMDKYCIPSPVIGGLLVCMLCTVLHYVGFTIILNHTIKDLLIVAFVTAIGFQVDILLLRQSAKFLVSVLVCITIFIVLQNLISLTCAAIGNINPYLSLTTGSITMMGGESFSKYYGAILEDLTLAGAQGLCMSTATAGIILGTFVGAPFGRWLIIKYQLRPDPQSLASLFQTKHPNDTGELLIFERISKATYMLFFTMGLGITACQLLKTIGIHIPDYLGTLVVAILLRNISDATGKFNLEIGELIYIGNLALSLFIGISFSELSLWQLTNFSGVQLVLILIQVMFTLLFAYVLFKFSGSDYDAAVLSGASCGFGLGSTSCSIANIIALNSKFGYSIKAFLLVPIAGAILADPINTFVINYVLTML